MRLIASMVLGGNGGVKVTLPACMTPVIGNTRRTVVRRWISTKNSIEDNGCCSMMKEIDVVVVVVRRLRGICQGIRRTRRGVGCHYSPT